MHFYLKLYNILMSLPPNQQQGLQSMKNHQKQFCPSSRKHQKQIFLEQALSYQLKPKKRQCKNRNKNAKIQFSNTKLQLKTISKRQWKQSLKKRTKFMVANIEKKKMWAIEQIQNSIDDQGDQEFLSSEQTQFEQGYQRQRQYQNDVNQLDYYRQRQFQNEVDYDDYYDYGNCYEDYYEYGDYYADYYENYNGGYHNRNTFTYNGLSFGEYGNDSYPWWNPTGLNTWDRLLYDTD